MGVAVKQEWVDDAKVHGWTDEPVKASQVDTSELRELLARVRENLSKTRQLSQLGRAKRAA